MRNILMLALLILITACSDSEAEKERSYDLGQSDGYAVGYNSTCNIRTTLIKGDWDNQDYTNGYNSGFQSGATDCKNSSDYR